MVFRFCCGTLFSSKIFYRSRDHVVEQLLPVYSWQSLWFTLPTPHRNESDVYRVLTNTGQTQVRVQLSDGTWLRTMNSTTPREYIQVCCHFYIIYFSTSVSNYFSHFTFVFFSWWICIFV